MPRYFRPKGGFSHSNVDRIRIEDDGSTFEVLKDGTDRPAAYVGGGRVSRPTWNLQELENLVAGGSWEEVKADAPKPAPVALAKKQPAPPVTNEPQAKQE